MPTVNEVIPNKKLTGTEVSIVIQNRVKRMLDMDGVLGPHVAYGRLGFEVVIKLHLDNPTYNEHVMRTKSQTQRNEPVLESPPLKKPSSKAKVVGRKSFHKIDNPNKERVLNGLPIPIEAMSRETGHVEERQIKYAKEDVDVEEEEAVVEDVSKKVSSEWEVD